jgi:hypothetical protein
MLGLFGRSRASHRAATREDRPGATVRLWARLRSSGGVSLVIAAGFTAIAVAIAMPREQVVLYRPGQQANHDVVARVGFTFNDKDELQKARQQARQRVPRVYMPNPAVDVWGAVEQRLLALPDRVATAALLQDVAPDLREVLDSGSFTLLKQYEQDPARRNYVRHVQEYIQSIRSPDEADPRAGLFILPPEQREPDLARETLKVRSADGGQLVEVRTESTYTPQSVAALEQRLAQHARGTLDLTLQPKFVTITLRYIQPTHVIDEAATAEAQNRAEAEVPRSAGDSQYAQNQVIVKAGVVVDDRIWQVLRAENKAFLHGLDPQLWRSRLGAAVMVILISAALAYYVARFESRIARKHQRGVALAAVLLVTLLVAQLAAIGSSQIYAFAVAPTILVAMVMAIVYNQRFAIGIGLGHAVLATVVTGQGFGFLFVLVSGVLACCFLMDDVRTRSKLVEVGGAAALAMMVTSLALGMMSLDPLGYSIKTALYTGAAGLAVGFLVLGILDLIERTFRITTSMRLLELADPSHPLLRRLAVEAAGTYAHSLQVATLSEAAAEAIGANSLLCRVASYFHDVGKINKADYFIENQVDGQNRHLNLSPDVSLQIILGHVKDGIALAREYDLPTSLFPFIQTHHGTTVVEYFYHRAVNSPEQRAVDAPAVDEEHYRYPGPRPRTRECGIVMIADACESATRAMSDPSAARVEALVHDLIMRRLTDGQFGESELSLRELELVEAACVRTLQGIHHSRIAYPSQARLVESTPGSATGAVKSA